MIRVLIADDHPVVRQGLRTFLGVQEDIDVVGEAADGAEAVSRAESLTPDVILLDLNMPDVDGLTALHELRERGVRARVLVLTSVGERREGAAGRTRGRGRIPVQGRRPARARAGDTCGARRERAVRPRGRGRRYWAPDQGGKGTAMLTEREREVLAQIARGRSNREIARALVVSEKTVKTHVSNILMKLGLQDRTQAALYAVRHGLAER